MKQTILILSYVGKAAGFVAALNSIPGLDPKTGVIIFFIASLLKDTANRIDDFLTTNFLPSTKGTSTPMVAAAAALLLGGLGLTGCSTASTSGTASAGLPSPTSGGLAVGSKGSSSTQTTSAGGVRWALIQAKIDTALLDVQKASAGLAQSGLVPAGKATDTVNDASTVSNALFTTLGTGTIDPTQAAAVAQSFHSDKATTNYVALGVMGTDLLIGLTKDLIAAGATKSQITAAQTQALVGLPTAVQQGVTAPPPAPASTTYQLHPVARDSAGSLGYSFEPRDQPMLASDPITAVADAVTALADIAKPLLDEHLTQQTDEECTQTMLRIQEAANADQAARGSQLAGLAARLCIDNGYPVGGLGDDESVPMGYVTALLAIAAERRRDTRKANDLVHALTTK